MITPSDNDAWRHTSNRLSNAESLSRPTGPGRITGEPAGHPATRHRGPNG